MSEGCTHDCENCASKCSDKKSLKEELNAASSVKKVYAVMSGKGGVGKSLVTSMLAVTAQRRGFKTAVLDADITGPSIPTAFNIHERANTNMYGIIPAVSKTGIEIMSLNLLLENETDPVVWRGPVIAGAVKQFWTDVAWNDVDVMFIDMPPGTGARQPLRAGESCARTQEPYDGIGGRSRCHDPQPELFPCAAPSRSAARGDGQGGQLRRRGFRGGPDAPASGGQLPGRSFRRRRGAAPRAGN